MGQYKRRWNGHKYNVYTEYYDGKWHAKMYSDNTFTMGEYSHHGWGETEQKALDDLDDRCLTLASFHGL